MKASPSSNYLVLIFLKDLDIDLVEVRQARAVAQRMGDARRPQ